MHAKYYQRKRETGLKDKPILQNVFALKHNSANNNLSVKTLFLTKDEYAKLLTEINGLAQEAELASLMNTPDKVEAVLGVPLEILDSFEGEVINPLPELEQKTGANKNKAPKKLTKKKR